MHGCFEFDSVNLDLESVAADIRIFVLSFIEEDDKLSGLPSALKRKISKAMEIGNSGV